MTIIDELEAMKDNNPTDEKETPPETGVEIEDIQANFSALLYLVTEQQATMAFLLQELLDGGRLDLAQITRITDRELQQESITKLYSQIYKKFCYYFLRTKEILENREILGPALKEIMQAAKEAKEKLEGKDGSK